MYRAIAQTALSEDEQTSSAHGPIHIVQCPAHASSIAKVFTSVLGGTIEIYTPTHEYLFAAARSHSTRTSAVRF